MQMLELSTSNVPVVPLVGDGQVELAGCVPVFGQFVQRFAF